MPELNGFAARQVDDHDLEVEVQQNQTLNDLFEQLERGGVTVDTMRTKTNRLEELFIRLVESKNGAEAAGA